MQGLLSSVTLSVLNTPSRASIKLLSLPFDVRSMFPATLAVLLEFNLALHGLLVLVRVVVRGLADRARHLDEIVL